MFKQFLPFITIVFTGLIVTPVLASHSFELTHHSRYLSEGLDNLTAGGIVWVNTEISLDDGVSAMLNFGTATHSVDDYSEVELALQYANSIGQFEYYLGASHISFPNTSEQENELFIGAAWPNKSGVEPFLNVVYSEALNGRYAELGVEHSRQIGNKMALNISLLVGFDDNYIGQGGSIYHHSQLRFGYQQEWTKALILLVHAEYNFGFSEEAKRQADRSHNSSLNIGVRYQF